MPFTVKTDHPALEGHFPGDPVAPGVVILDHILAVLGDELPLYQVMGIRKLKILRPLLLDRVCEVQWSDVRDGRLRFNGVQDGERIVEGTLIVEVAL